MTIHALRIAMALLQAPSVSVAGPRTRADTLAMVALAAAELRDHDIVAVGGHVSTDQNSPGGRFMTDSAILRAIADSLGLGLDTTTTSTLAPRCPSETSVAQDARGYRIEAARLVSRKLEPGDTITNTALFAAQFTRTCRRHDALGFYLTTLVPIQAARAGGAMVWRAGVVRADPDPPSQLRESGFRERLGGFAFSPLAYGAFLFPILALAVAPGGRRAIKTLLAVWGAAGLLLALLIPGGIPLWFSLSLLPPVFYVVASGRENADGSERLTLGRATLTLVLTWPFCFGLFMILLWHAL